MSLTICRIEAEDFMCFARVDFDLTGYRGVTLVEGFRGARRSNGSGKSIFIAEMVTWCLFGDTCRRRSSAGKVIRRGCDHCFVRVTLTVGEESVVVERGRNKTGPYLHISGLPAEGTIAGMQERLEAAIGYTFRSWTASVVFSGALSAFCRMTDSERKQLLQRMVGADKYEEAAKVAAKRVDGLQQERGDSVQRHAEAQGKLGSLRSMLQAQASEALGAVGRLMQRIREKRVENVGLAEEAMAASERFAKWIMEDRKKQQEAQVLLDGIDANLAEYGQELAEAQKIMEALRQNEGAAIHQVEVLAREKRGYTDADHPPRCPTCHQPWPKTRTSYQLKEILGRLDAQSVLAEETLARVRREIEKRAVDRRSTEEHVQALRKRRDLLASSTTEEEGRSLLTAAVELERDLRSAQKGLLEEEASWDPEGTPAAIAELRAQVEVSRDAVKECAGQLKGIDEKIRKVRFWKEGFGRSGLPAFLLDSAVPDMNRVAGEVAGALSDGELTVQFDSAVAKGSGDVFGVRVDYKDGADTYEETSDGEHLRVDMVVLLSIRELIAARAPHPCTLLVIDEVLDGGDGAFADAFIRVLRERYADLSIFLISHRDDVCALADQTITVVKEAGTSTISCVATGSA